MYRPFKGENSVKKIKTKPARVQNIGAVTERDDKKGFQSMSTYEHYLDLYSYMRRLAINRGGRNSPQFHSSSSIVHSSCIQLFPKVDRTL